MIKRIFTENNIVLNATANDKWDAIQQCGQILKEQGYVKDAYLEDMLKREEEASVYVGNHVAIPHGISFSQDHIIESGISFMQVPEGVEFEGGTAYMLIGIAGKNGEHIELLGKIAMICCDMENIERLKTAKNKQEINQVFQSLLYD